MTGANAARHGVTNWTFRKNTATDEPHPVLTMPQWNVNGIQPVAGVPHSFHATSLAQFLPIMDITLFTAERLTLVQRIPHRLIR